MSSGKIGVTMNRYGVVLPRGGYLASLKRGINISKEAKKRLIYIFNHLIFLLFDLSSTYTFYRQTF
jgi:hypothetical protein